MLFSITGYLSVKFDGRAVIYDGHGDCMASGQEAGAFFNFLIGIFKNNIRLEDGGVDNMGRRIRRNTTAVERKQTLF